MRKKLYLILYILIFVTYMEIIFKFSTFKNLFDVSFIYLLLFSSAFALGIYIIGGTFARVFNKYIVSIILLMLTFIYISQLLYFKIYDGIFSLSTTGQANAIFEYFGFVFEKTISNIIFILLMIVPIVLFFVLKKDFFDFRRVSLKSKLIIIISFLILQFSATSFLERGDMYSAYNLYHNVNAPALMARNFGLITTVRLDVQRAIFGFDKGDSLFIMPDKKEEDNKEEEREYNELIIDWQKLIEDEKDEKIRVLHEYFRDSSSTNKNEYTGLFKGKNLIWFIAESFDYIAIDKEITPTLYKMYDEGFNFSNFYTPIFLSTIDGEYMTKTGLLPREGVWSMYRSSENSMPFVLGNLFNNIGYKSTAYHNGQATYYRRHLSHPNLGYDYYACGRNLDINCKLWPQSDLEMINATAGSYINRDQPFLTYYLTISGHLRYNKYNAIATKNWDLVKHAPYSDTIKYYMSQHVELDKAIEKIISYLEDEGIAEDTVIAISSDHWPYGLTVEELNEKADNNRDDFFERDRMPFIIWHKGILGQEFTKLGSSIDVMPTLANLFGLEYDSRLLMGKDLFSDAEPLVIFANRSWITNKGKYDNTTKTFLNVNNDEVDADYVDRINTMVYNRFYISGMVLDNDYYKKIIVEKNKDLQ